MSPPEIPTQRNLDGALAAAREAFGTPALILFASYIGFGSLVRDNGFALWLGLTSTVTAWALPGQIALVELFSAGASLLTITLAVALTNLRLMPMTIVLMPWLRSPGRPRWHYFLAAHLIAVTGWAAALQRCPQLPEGQRLPYLTGFSSVLWVASMAGTAIGYAAAGSVPVELGLGLVFLNPVYFLLLFISDLRLRIRALSLAYGALLGPPLYLWNPDWSLVVAGVVGGIGAMVTDRLLRGAHG